MGFLVTKKIKVAGSVLLAVSAYLDITQPAVPAWLEDIPTYATQHSMGLIMAIDTNAHSYLYGPDSNRRGEDFESYLFQHHLVIHNRGHTPTFETSCRSSCIDVTLSHSLPGVVKRWHVSQQYNASDHNYILSLIHI